MTGDRAVGPEPAWDAVTWDGHRDWQRRSFLAAWPGERLRWLEEALRFAAACGALSDKATQRGREVSGARSGV